MGLGQHQQHSSGRIVGGILVASLFLTLMIAAVAWVSTHYFTRRESSPVRRDDLPREALVFGYTIGAEVGHIRVNGTADLPNGIVLVGTLDRVGGGALEVKEALVMNRLFRLEFGPELSLKYLLHDPQNALQPGVYRLTVAFDPSRQSPFIQEPLLRLPFMQASWRPGNSSREVDAASIRLSKTFTIGTPEEQRESEVREQQARATIYHYLRDTLERLTGLWSSLQVRYQQERLKGGFSRVDPRASEWQAWAAQWLHDLKGLGEEAQLHEAVFPVTPHFTAQHALVNVYKQLIAMPELYFEVLVDERTVTDRDLQRAEHVIQSSWGDAIAELGQPDNISFPAKVESAHPTVIVTAPLVNVRSGPGMSHESIKQLKKDEALDFLSEHGEWFQVQLGGGRTGWVHRNVASKRPRGDGSVDDLKRVEAKPSGLEKRPALRLEPIDLSSTPIELIPRPTSDEVRIYLELEQQLRDVKAANAEERRAVEQRSLQRMSDKHGITPEQIWNAYLKVQGWEIRP